MVDPVSTAVTAAASFGKAVAVEAFKGRGKTIIEKLGRSNTQNLKKIVIWCELAVMELESLNTDFLDAIDQKHPSVEASATFLLWSAQVSETASSVRTFINNHKSGKKQPIALPECLTKAMKLKTIQVSQIKIIIDHLLNLAHRFDQNINFLFVQRPPKKVLERQGDPHLVGFPPFAGLWKEALTLLKMSEMKSIGISGPFGVGKRMFLSNLNNCEEVAKLFDMVIFLDGSDVESDANLLEAIARRIKLPQDIQVTAESVSLELSKYTNCLLLLDDVRKVCTQLKMLPYSKVVLTIRSEFTRICNPFVNKMIKMPPSLTTNEAWQMFREIVGKDEIRKLHIEEEARMISNLCGDIYFVIRTIAIHFKENITADQKENTAAFWKDQLRKLKKKNILKRKGMEEVYDYWKSCYDQLKDNIRNCFLYAALHPAGRKIRTQHLIETWTAEGLVKSNANSMTRCEMLDKGRMVLRKLTDLALLEKHRQSVMFVEMSRSIHGFAMLVQSQGDDKGKVVIKTGAAESPTPEDWKKAKRMSMVNNNVCELPETTGCENLLTLLLQDNSTLTSIPSSFFKHMNKLVLLDLCKTGIAKLPSSISFLVALKALYLNDCNQLTVLPTEIKKLKSLEVLDIRDTQIYYIPKHIWSLVKLKCFRTSYTENLPKKKEGEDRNVVSGLPILEELVIYVKSYQSWCKEVEHIITFVAGTKKLSNLRFCFPNEELVKTFLDMDVIRNLSSFHIYVGCENKYYPEITERLERDGIFRYLRYCNGKNGVTDEMKCILARSQTLELVGHKEIIRLSDLGSKSFKSVCDCVIESCDKMVTLSAGIDIHKMLPCLQKLYLRSLESLKGVADWELQVVESLNGVADLELTVVESLNGVAEAEKPSFSWGLEVLELKDCPNLTKIFSEKVLQRLKELKTLVVENCGGIEVLIPKPKGSEVQVLPALQTLRLLNLQKLGTICEEDKNISWPSLEVLEISGCPRLKKLPISKDRAPRLRVYEGEQLHKWMAAPKN